jgi:hypothetical protein
MLDNFKTTWKAEQVVQKKVRTEKKARRDAMSFGEKTRETLMPFVVGAFVFGMIWILFVMPMLDIKNFDETGHRRVTWEALSKWWHSNDAEVLISTPRYVVIETNMWFARLKERLVTTQSKAESECAAHGKPGGYPKLTSYNWAWNRFTFDCVGN